MNLSDLKPACELQKGIYKILNVITGMFYIGSAVDFYMRFYKHKYDLNKGNHKNEVLQNAWNKYGQNSFKFIIIEHCELTNLREREQYYLDTLYPHVRGIGYNLCPTAGTSLGYKHTPESLLKISAAHKNRTYKKQSVEQIEHRMKFVRGVPKSAEHRAKMSEVRKGQPVDPERIEKMRLSNIGRVQSQETKDKRIASMKGKNRKASKWQCPDGWKCKCDWCRLIRNQMNYSYRNKNEHN